MDSLVVIVEGTEHTIIGGDFWDMLAKVKGIPGRKYNQKKWELPCTLSETRSLIQPFQIVGEEEMLDAEIADIQRAQSRLLELAPEIEKRTSKLDEEIEHYSYRSKSNVKAGLAHDSSLLFHALENARVPLEQLTEPQIKGMHAALRLLEGE